MWQRTAGASLVLGCVVAWSSVGRAETNSCVTAYERAQELRAEQQLREARRNLAACIEPSCAEFVRTECGRWLSEVESSLPSVVLAAKISGKDTDKVRVLYDGEPLTEVLDGKAIAVDPGPHTLTFFAEGTKPLELKLVFREGEKNRLISTELGDAEKSVQHFERPNLAQASSSSTSQSQSLLPYILGGVGLAGVAGFAVLGLMGNSDLAERERTCAPACSDSDVGSVKTKYILADVSLGVGLVSLGAAGYLLLTSPGGTSRTATVVGSPGVDVRVAGDGGFASFRVKF